VKILVLSDNYTPEIAASSFRTHEHAKVWLEHGHQVTVVTCAPNWPEGKLFAGYRNRLYQQEWIDGVRVIRLWSYMTANKGFLRRTADYASYMASATAFSWRYPDFDVVLATSPQFFTAVAGSAVSRLRRRPWVFELRDLWPASIKAVGVAGGRLIAALEKLELYLYRSSDRIIALTDAFKRNLVRRGISPGKIDVVTNGVDLEKFAPANVTWNARQRLGILPHEFVVGYIGTTGMAHGLDTLLDAADLCRDRCRVRFLIMGQGAHRQALQQRARQMRLDNVLFVEPVPYEQIPNYYAALDVSLVHLKPNPLFQTVIPSKMFECMAMGKPILMAVEGEAAEIVKKAGCGVCIRPGTAIDMADAVSRLARDRKSLVSMGRRGRQAVTRRYNRRVKAEEVLRSLETAVELSNGPARKSRCEKPRIWIPSGSNGWPAPRRRTAA
jgi:hypothetical protein